MTADGVRRADDELVDLFGEWSQELAREIPDAVALRHAIHRNPDVSGQEEATVGRVLRALGDVPEQIDTVAGTGRLILLGPPGPAVGVRAELDALPMAEATGAPFASLSSATHACGHDVHLAALTALARSARAVRLPLGFAALLQPREEVGPTGARDVITEGALAARDVRVLIGAHVQPVLPAGAVACDPGPVNAAVDEVEIIITGRGGHGAYPHLTADPVPPLLRTVLALQDALRIGVDPLQPAVVSMTQLRGSDAPNVIPDVARAAGTVRTLRAGDAAALHRRIAAVVTGTAAAHGCTGEYLVRRGEPALDNDPFLAASARSWVRAADLRAASFASCGSDDFATYGELLPILMLFVGTGPAARTDNADSADRTDNADSTDREPAEAAPMLHDPRFLPADEAVHDVAKAMLAGWFAGVERVRQDAASGQVVGTETSGRPDPWR